MASLAPLSVIESLEQHLLTGDPLDEEHREILLGALEAYRTLPGLSLDRILGLRRRGGISPARSNAIRQRDDLLVTLWRSHEEFAGHPAMVAARKMSQSASRYAMGRWPRERYDFSAPAAEPAATWWRILTHCGRIPGTRRIQQILSREIQSDV